jgi:HEPN domain-containing protein
MVRYEEWIKRAKSSLEFAQLKSVKHIYYEDFCFQLQQAVEKAIKGVFIYFNVEPEFTHNIEKLLEELKPLTDIPENVIKATALTKYAVFTRYPGEFDEVTKDEYEASVKIAQECVEWVENRIKEIESKKNKII